MMRTFMSDRTAALHRDRFRDDGDRLLLALELGEATGWGRAFAIEILTSAATFVAPQAM